jgi:hypothetical protein
MALSFPSISTILKNVTMKKIILIAGCIALCAMSNNLYAQNDDHSTLQHVEKGVKKGAHEVKKGVKRGAHEVAQQSSELKADATHHELETKMGPHGEDVFVDDNGRYFYVDQKGHNVYVKKSALRNKVKDKK